MFSLRLRSHSLKLAAVLILSLISIREAVPVFSDETVNVSANVGVANQPPFIVSVKPSASPTLVAKNTFQTFSIQITDPDSSAILYTVSSSSGAVLPSSGTAPVVGGSAQVNFTYFAPSYKAKLVPVTVTLNDQSGTRPIVRTIDVYVY